MLAIVGRPRLQVWGPIEMPYAFANLDSRQQIQAGGEGAALAWLFQAGYPVPEGFVILSVEFDDDVLRPEALTELQGYLWKMRHVWPDAAFAVRSSALGCRGSC
jgi:pyruvate,water dikinase